MKKLITLFVLLPIFLSNAQNNFNFNIDFSSFKYDSASNYVEFYYSFPQNQLKIINENNQLMVEGLLHLQIKDTDTNKDFLNKTWRIPIALNDTTAGSMQQSLVGAIGFVVPKGKYTCYASGSDKNNSEVKKDYNFPLNVSLFGSTDMTISDIELASSIKQEEVDKTSIFYKNTLEVVPMPSDIFGESSPALYYYSEIYNLDKVENLSHLTYETSLFDSHGRKLYLKHKKLGNALAATADVGVINVSKYPSGKYTLILSLSDSTKNIGITSKKEFFIYNPGIKDTTTFAARTGDVISSQFAFLSSEECDDIFDKAQYISTDKEKDQYEKIHTVDGKREFLFTFWKNKYNATGVGNHYVYTDYIKRVKEANTRFKNIGNKGWRTDMGRVFIKYGEPSTIEKHPNVKNTRPYEVWQYESIEGGVYFIFGDLTGFSNYVLLTSNKRGEYEDPNWQSRIGTVPGSSNILGN